MFTRFAFEESGESEVINGVPVREVHFSEVLSPTLIGGGQNEDRPANGRVWISPETGEVLRTELILKAESGAISYQATMDVTYEASGQLGILVPQMMREHYQSDLHTVETRADYENFQRFDTDVSFSVDAENALEGAETVR